MSKLFKSLFALLFVIVSQSVSAEDVEPVRLPLDRNDPRVQELLRQLETYGRLLDDAPEIPAPKVNEKLTPEVVKILREMSDHAEEIEREKYKGAATNQGKTGPIGFGAIKLGMRILDIYAIPESEATRIPTEGWKKTMLPHPQICEKIGTSSSCVGPLPTEISFKDWMRNPYKFPGRVDFKVNILNPFVKQGLEGFLETTDGLVTSIRIDISSSISTQFVLSLKDDIFNSLKEKYGAVKPKTHKMEIICGKDIYENKTTWHSWSDRNKLLGNVTSNLRVSENFNCYSGNQLRKEVEVFFTTTISKENAAPSIKNVF